ncbi:PREDICTED: protein plastid transcriptionally active 16, chloroplastic [Tarenaya hassleriana]|uniref:protein plastid transcriptionally active 16, chloroplastic n=1 Tax=Tarenaya hassleriana TaxID=28532 RepID=UPI00053C4657|nr:PREDICTED: protein plastid transcriptionally active 16, chloroplastic [Tarenaya hassleriana]
MASNSFPLTTAPTQRTRLNRRKPSLILAAKPASIKLGKTNKDDSEASQPKSSSSPSGFRFNFGNLQDVKSLIPVVNNPSTGLAFGNNRRKDSGTVFVAGATGQVGIRIAQTLLQKGFSVRAGVPDLGAAQDLARVAATYKMISKDEARRLNAVESTFQDAESIAKAIGNATKVVVTVGNGENGPDAVVSTSDALLVVQAAELAGVSHVAIVYDNVTGSTYNVLDGITSFFNNIFARSQTLTVSEFLESVVRTDVAYTFIKTSLTEDFSPENSYNVVVSAEGSSGNDAGDSSVAYKVGKMKIASLVADVFSNTAVAENKVVEVFTDPSAPSRSVDELFSVIPEDGRRKAYAEAAAKEKAEEEERIAAEKAREATEAARKLSEQEAGAATLTEEAQQKAEAAGFTMDGLINRAKGISSGISWDKFGSQITTAVQNAAAETPKVQVATVRGQAKARNLTPKKAVVKPPNENADAKAKPAFASAFALKKNEERGKKEREPEKKEVRKVLGGLFKQETMYVDDD